MVLALYSVPEEVRNRMEKKLIAKMGTLAYRKEVKRAMDMFDFRIPRSDGVSLTGWEWITSRHFSDGGVKLGVYIGIQASGLKRSRIHSHG